MMETYATELKLALVEFVSLAPTLDLELHVPQMVLSVTVLKNVMELVLVFPLVILALEEMFATINVTKLLITVIHLRQPLATTTYFVQQPINVMVLVLVLVLVILALVEMLATINVMKM